MKDKLALSSLTAVSPLDGRYSAATEPLREYFSEYALIKARAEIELRYLMAFDDMKVFLALAADEKKRIAQLLDGFSEQDAARVKELEATTRHDVKALEFFLRERLELAQPNRIHFGLTSEDVNNLAYSMLLDRFTRQCYRPALKSLLGDLAEMAETGAAQPFPTRTHGQPASPTTAGKELAVWLHRLRLLAERLVSFKFTGKCNGATGTWASWKAAAPQHDWPAFFENFVGSLGLEWNPLTTQIEDHDRWAGFFNMVRQINNVVVDLDQDIWLWLMNGWYSERAVAGEIGSSTMPHKVNPIRFENSEGNLLLANSLLVFMSDKLCRSRLQRDLSDSTVSRNIGVALAHSYLGICETTHGLQRLEVCPARCLGELEAHPELLAEPIQTILRPVLATDPYILLKNATRGRQWTKQDQAAFIGALAVSEEVKTSLQALKVEDYTGFAERVCRDEIGQTRRLLEEL